MILYNTIKNIICKYNSFYGIKMIIINNYLTGTYCYGDTNVYKGSRMLFYHIDLYLVIDIITFTKLKENNDLIVYI